MFILFFFFLFTLVSCYSPFIPLPLVFCLILIPLYSLSSYIPLPLRSPLFIPSLLLSSSFSSALFYLPFVFSSVPVYFLPSYLPFDLLSFIPIPLISFSLNFPLIYSLLLNLNARIFSSLTYLLYRSPIFVYSLSRHLPFVLFYYQSVLCFLIFPVIFSSFFSFHSLLFFLYPFPLIISSFALFFPSLFPFIQTFLSLFC